MATSMQRPSLSAPNLTYGAPLPHTNPAPSLPVFSLDQISQKAIQILTAPTSADNTAELRQHFSAITPAQLQQVLNTMTQSLIRIEDPLSAIRQLAEMLVLERLQLAAAPIEKKAKNQQAIDALEAAKNMYQDALYYLNKTESDLTPSLKTHLSSICDSFISVLESLLAAFGIADVFTTPENEMHANMKGQKLMSMVHLFDMLSRSLLPLVGDAFTGMITGGTLLFISALSLIYPAIKPTPPKLPQGENWTRLYEQGLLQAPEGREPILNAMYNALTHNKDKRHFPMLLGESGIGKTETVRAFVRAIERGDYPELKGKQVFYFNTSQLVHCYEMFGGSNKIISKIKEILGSHKEDVILIFDEIHSACKENQFSAIGEQLKTDLDSGAFPYFIGITTEDEFNEHIYKNNYAFANRFEKIIVSSTEPKETLKILNNTLLRQAPSVIVDDGAIEYLLEQTASRITDRTAQPTTSLDILSKCIRRTAKSQKSPLQEKIEKKRCEIDSLRSQNVTRRFNTRSFKLEKKRHDQIRKLESDLTTLAEQLNVENRAKADLFKTRDTLLTLKEEVFRTAIKVHSLQPGALNLKDKQELNTFLLLRHFLAPQMEEHVCNEAAVLDVKTVIDTGLIDAAIEERIENDEKSKRARANGREARQLRQE